LLRLLLLLLLVWDDWPFNATGSRLKPCEAHWAMLCCAMLCTSELLSARQ
jgi:hypothetical protein